MPEGDDSRLCEAEGPDPGDRCYETMEEGVAVEACLQRLVDDGQLRAAVLAEFSCLTVYESLPSDASDEDYARAGEVFERCMVEVGTAPDVVEGDGGTSGSPITTVPATG